jgi:hypothetical protein
MHLSCCFNRYGGGITDTCVKQQLAVKAIVEKEEDRQSKKGGWALLKGRQTICRTPPVSLRSAVQRSRRLLLAAQHNADIWHDICQHSRNTSSPMRPAISAR